MRLSLMVVGFHGRTHALTLDTNASNVRAIAPPTRSAPPHIMTDTRLPPHLQPFRRPDIRGQANGVTLCNLHLLPREDTGRDKPKGCTSFCPHVSDKAFSVSSPTRPDVSSQKIGSEKPQTAPSSKRRHSCRRLSGCRSRAGDIRSGVIWTADLGDPHWPTVAAAPRRTHR